MKNNPRQGPDLESIIGNLSKGQEAKTPAPPPDRSHAGSISEDQAHQGRLWEEFITTLNDPDEESETDRSKLYAIDEDIVETLHQCNFGKPNVEVINSILRTFLIDNISRLRNMYRPRSKSLLDKYE